jgi:Na+/glutamate symporter
MKTKFLKIVQDYYNYVWGLVILIVLFRAARCFYMYAVVDKFLRDEYKDAAKYWKMANEKAATNALINQKMITREAEAKEYFDQMEKFWYEYGPISSVMLIIATVSCCSTILCCFSRYRKNLEEYEDSPFNPHNGSDI